MVKIFHGYFSQLIAIFLLPLLSQACFAGTLTQEELSNATYSGVEEDPVTLTDGRWEGEPFAEGGASRPSVGLVEDFRLLGDLDGDGKDESVVILWESSGGSGTYSYVAVVGKKDGAVKNLATAEIGDRVQVRSGSIEDGHTVLDVVQQGEGEAACCPTQLASRSWSLAGGELNEGEAQLTGTLSIETLNGSNWVLTNMKQDEPLPEGSEVTLLFADGQVSGKSACNRYSASVEQGGSPSELKIGPAMGTRMACPDGLMELESQYLEALSQVTGFSFLAGKLVLNWGEDGGWSAMFFAPR